MTEKFIACNDCGKTIEKGDKMTEYEVENRGKFYKCDKCYKVNKKLEGFQKCEVYTRCVGYIRPKDQFNPGKAEEVDDRRMYKINTKEW